VDALGLLGILADEDLLARVGGHSHWLLLHLAATAWAITAGKHQRLVGVDALGLLGILADEDLLARVGGHSHWLLLHLAATAWAITAGKHQRLVGVDALRLLRFKLHTLPNKSGGCQRLLGHHEFALNCCLVDQFHQLLTAYFFLLQQHIREVVQNVHVRPQQPHAPPVLRVHDSLDLGIDERPEALRHRRRPLPHEVPAHEGAAPALLLPHDALPHRLRHPQLRDHGRSHLRALLEVVRRARRDIVCAVDDLLGDATAQRHAHTVLEELLGVQAGVETVL